MFYSRLKNCRAGWHREAVELLESPAPGCSPSDGQCEDGPDKPYVDWSLTRGESAASEALRSTRLNRPAGADSDDGVAAEAVAFGGVEPTP